MYFKDLSDYHYHLPFELPNVFNVGWLNRDGKFPIALPSATLIDKLNKILLSSRGFEARVNPIRGVHSCNLCGLHILAVPFIGSCEIWIPARGVDAYFAAPSLVLHYIAEHNYFPPEDFLRSVALLDMSTPFNGQALYDKLIRKYGFSINPKR